MEDKQIETGFGKISQTNMRLLKETQPRFFSQFKQKAKKLKETLIEKYLWNYSR